MIVVTIALALVKFQEVTQVGFVPENIRNERERERETERLFVFVIVQLTPVLASF